PGDEVMSEYLNASLVQFESTAGMITPTINGLSQYVLIQGVVEETVTISVGVKTGYEFEVWQTDSTQITFADSTLTTTTISYIGEIAEDITIVIVIPPNKYYLQFETNPPELASHVIMGEMPNQELTFDKEETINKNLYTLVGWTFLGWADDNDNEIDFTDEQSVLNLTSEKSKVIVIYAVWRQNTYTLVYHTWQPSAEKTDSVIYRDPEIEAEIWSNEEIVQNFVYDNPVEVLLYKNPFELIGYTFTGWSLAEGGAAYYQDNQVALNLTAEDAAVVDIWTAWRANVYTIVFHANYATVSGNTHSMTCTYDETYTLTENAYSLDGCEFYGWALSSKDIKRFDNKQQIKNVSDYDGDVVNFYALFKKVFVFDHTVGGTITSEKQSIDYVVLSANERYLFTGESVDDLTAEEIEITLSYSSENPENYEIFTRRASCIATESSPYKFLYWSYSSITYEGIQNVSCYTAVFGRFFNVSYNAGSNPSTDEQIEADDIELEILEGTSISLRENTYTLTGYHFAGWQCDLDGNKYMENERFVITEDVVFTATWDANFYYVHFETNTPLSASNSVSGQLANQKLYFNAAENLSQNSFTLVGWTFQNWNTEFDGTGTDYADEEEVLNLRSNEGDVLTLYAIWSANTYSVVFNSNVPSNASTEISGVMENQSFTYEEQKALSSNSYVLSGYYFAGWATEQNSDQVAYENEELVQNLSSENNGEVVVYAVWQVNTYSVMFVANKPTKASNNVSGAMASQSLSFDEGGKTLDANQYVLIGWTFQNWNTLADGTGTDYADEAEVGNLTTIKDGIITLFAIWYENSYTVRYNGIAPQSASTTTSGSMGSQTFTFEEEKSLSKNKFALQGYNFSGWATEQNSDDISYEDEQVVKNIVQFDGGFIDLYAVWTPITFTVNYVSTLDDSGTMESQTFTFDVFQQLSQNQFAKSTFIFFGWSKTMYGSVEYANGQNVANLSSIDGDEVNLYTVFKKVIKFEAGFGGTVDDTSIQYFEQTFVVNGITYVFESVSDNVDEDNPSAIVNVIANYEYEGNVRSI
ncbi:MAG: InlB B-repeat-containing protein, partial [Clostridia bacterium]|nr:InlB B-repeat-containing protein [Clostridia bacterium]